MVAYLAVGGTPCIPSLVDVPMVHMVAYLALGGTPCKPKPLIPVPVALLEMPSQFLKLMLWLIELLPLKLEIFSFTSPPIKFYKNS